MNTKTTRVNALNPAISPAGNSFTPHAATPGTPVTDVCAATTMPCVQNPASFQRRILVAVTGLSPQIVTETLYALAVEQKPAFVPTEIHLITTGEGANRARLSLLSNEPGAFHALRHDYSLPEIDFSEKNIHVLTGSDGRTLTDISDEAENLAAADLITALVREFSADPESALHVSLAGGRKTMGFFLGYALTLLGRPQDRLSHVLISAPFESSWKFFYPTPHSEVIELAGGGLADASKAKVMLADIPFVSLRHGLPENLLQGRSSYSETVAAAQRAHAPASLVLEPEKRRIIAAGQSIELSPTLMALLTLFARRLLEDKGPICGPNESVPDEAWAAAFLAELRDIAGESRDIEETERSLKNGMDGNYFARIRSRLHNELRKHLGPAAAPYLIDGGRRRPLQYRLTLPKAAVSLIE